MDVVKILIADDHPLVRSGMQKILKDFFFSHQLYTKQKMDDKL